MFAFIVFIVHVEAIGRYFMKCVIQNAQYYPYTSSTHRYMYNKTGKDKLNCHYVKAYNFTLQCNHRHQVD